MSRTYRINHWLWSSLDWLFPPVCGGCGRKGFRWCPECQRQVKLVPEPTCRTCGLPLLYPGLCPICKESPPPIEAMRSWAVFEGSIRQAVHSLKYRRNVALGEALAPYLVEFARKLNWPIDLVVPVPLGRERIKERGYNQVGLLAQPLSRLQNWKYSPRLLRRVRETRSQVGLSPMERKANMAGAFKADTSLAPGKVVLLMDDVATTGATLAACSEALAEAGVKKVYALTLAKSLPQHGLQFV